MYLDYTSLILVDPIRDVTVSDSFFLGMGNIVLQSTAAGKGTIDGLSIQSNTFSNWNMPNNLSVVVDERSGTHFTSILDFTMGSNAACPKMTAVGVTVRGSSGEASSPSTRFEVDFRGKMVFPNAPIASTHYLLEVEDDGFARQALRPPSNMTVAVVTDVPVRAKATVTVSQSQYRPGNGGGI